ncbi:MAG: hypothetical protein ABW133_25900 [Polyangiaceae bacterium]
MNDARLSSTFSRRFAVAPRLFAGCIAAAMFVAPLSAAAQTAPPAPNPPSPRAADPELRADPPPHEEDRSQPVAPSRSADDPGSPAGPASKAPPAAHPAEEEPTPVAAEALSVTAQPPMRDKMTDGVYGRFDGDFELSLAAGAAVGPEGPSGVALGRAVFLQSAGIYVAYTDALGRENAALPRSLALGVTLRPFFIPRWALDLEHGPALLDLTLDSIAFDLGALWASDAQGSFSDDPGMEAALGAEVPILGTASGPFIGARGALRWRGAELSGDVADPLKPALFVTLSWHGLIDTNVVDAGDRRMR